MKIKIILILAIFSFTATLDSGAQIRSILREKAREALRTQEENEEGRVEKDEERPRQPSAFEKRMEDRMKKAMGLADLHFENQYHFNSSMSMDVESYDAASGEVSNITYTTYFNEEERSFAMRFQNQNADTGRDENTLMVFDMKNRVMLMVAESDNEKSGIAFSLGEAADEDMSTGIEGGEAGAALAADYEMQDFNLYYNKTGRTKTIAGFDSEEYVYENEEGRIEFWFSPESRFDFSSAYNYIGGLQALATAGGIYKGILMEMNHTDKQTNDRARMVVRSINPNTPSTIDLKDFSILGFGSQDGP
jgi:hypothetical protein